jgi:hypothetical protein
VVAVAAMNVVASAVTAHPAQTFKRPKTPPPALT